MTYRSALARPSVDISGESLQGGRADMAITLITDLLNHLYDAGFRAFMSLVEMNLVPDFVLRRGIRHLLSSRLKEVRPSNIPKSHSPP
jgi:hypothetical protein